MTYNKKEKDIYTGYLRNKGYTDSEVKEVDSYMTEQFGDSWVNQQTKTETEKKSRLQRFKEWCAYVITGRSKAKYKTEYERYKEKNGVQIQHPTSEAKKTSGVNWKRILMGAFAGIAVIYFLNKKRR